MPGQPVALIAGNALGPNELWPRLAEAAGGAVLEELTLDRLVETELSKRGLTTTDAMVAAERRLLVESIAASSAVGADEGERLLVEVRRARGLGDERFAALLRRNAGLRRLVGEVEVSEALVRQAFQTRYGERLRVRIIVTRTSGEAADAKAALGSPIDTARFADVAIRMSVDESAARGGQMDPFSPADPAISPALRAAANRLRVGEVGGPVVLERGHAVVLLEERLAPDERGFEQLQSSVRREVRLAQERSAMDKLARRLLAQNPPTVLDRSLNWGWQNRPASGAPVGGP